MVTTDQPFLDADASSKYAGLRTKQISKYAFVPWGKIVMWIAAAGAALIAAALLLNHLGS